MEAEDEEDEAEEVGWLDACEEEEVGVRSGPLGSSKEDGMQSHVSSPENLEQLSISRTLQRDNSRFEEKYKLEINQLLTDC